MQQEFLELNLVLVPAVAQVLPKQAPQLIWSKQERKADTVLPVKVKLRNPDCNFIETIVFTQKISSDYWNILAYKDSQEILELTLVFYWRSVKVWEYME